MNNRKAYDIGTISTLIVETICAALDNVGMPYEIDHTTMRMLVGSPSTTIQEKCLEALDSYFHVANDLDEDFGAATGMSSTATLDNSTSIGDVIPAGMNGEKGSGDLFPLLSLSQYRLRKKKKKKEQEEEEEEEGNDE